MGVVAFVDPVCPTPYGPTTMATRAMGGSEASVVRIAERLAARHSVIVAQHNRAAGDIEQAGAAYVSLDDLAERGDEPDAVVVMRAARMLPSVAEVYPDARRLLWITDWMVKPIARPEGLRELLAAGTTILAVSRAHRDNLHASLGVADLAAFDFIYPPVDDDLAPDATVVDRDQLIYFSRPDHRLDEVLAAFDRVRRELPAMWLAIADPGYLDRALPAIDHVRVLGALPGREVLRHVRASLCAFYPQTCVAEAFGLVFAESNAVATPVLAHAFGAAPEILSADQLIDASDLDRVVERVVGWYHGDRPSVTLDPKFRVDAVAARWEQVLFGR